MATKDVVYVIGHKNPDTDSICSAIAYADIKNRTGLKTYIPKFNKKHFNLNFIS